MGMQGFAYVEFLEADAVTSAALLDGTELRGREIKVAFSHAAMHHMSVHTSLLLSACGAIILFVSEHTHFPPILCVNLVPWLNCVFSSFRQEMRSASCIQGCL